MSAFLALAPSVAQAAPADTAAQCFPPGTSASYPPAPARAEPSLSVSLSNGLLLPGEHNGRLVVTGAIPSLDYCGTLFSTPVTLPVTTASSTGVLDFANLAIPSNFQLGVVHHLDVYRRAQLVGAFDFCVNDQGHLVNASTCPGGGVKNAGSLPRTGLARLADALKAAGVAFAAGVLFLYLRRRRAAGAAQA